MQAQAGEQEGVLRELEAKNRALADREVAKQRELAALREQFATAQVLSLLALQVQEVHITGEGCARTGAQFTCCTSAPVRILTE